VNGLLLSLHVSLVAEKAAVFGRVIFRQGINAIGPMAVCTEFFGFLFVHGHKAFVVIVMGQPGGSFRGCRPEYEKNAGTEYQEEQIVDEYFFLTVNFFVHHVPLGVLI